MAGTFFTHAAIANQFRRQHGLTDRSKLFDDPSDDRQAFLLQSIVPEGDENPVFAYYGSDDEWLVVTDRRLVWSVDGARQHVRLVDLISIDADWSGRFEREARNGMDVSEIKSSFNELTIEDCDNRRLLMRVEQGPAFYGVWGALRTLAVWAGSERREAGRKD